MSQLEQSHHSQGSQVRLIIIVIKLVNFGSILVTRKQ